MTAWHRAVERALASEVDGPPARSRRRDWLADAGWFAFAAVLGVLGLVDSANHGLDGPLLVLDAVLGVAACLSVWWRRRWPVALALATVAAVPLSSSAGAASLVLMFTVAAWCPWPFAVLVLALHVGALPLERVVHPQGDSPWTYYPLSVIGLTVFVVWGAFLGGRREARRERARRAEAEDRLRLEQARHAERARIAREMHDVLAHRISLLSLHAGALEFRPDASPEEVARAAGVIRASAHQALEDLREVIGVLRDGTVAPGDVPPSPPQPTLAGLPGLLEESRAAGMTLRAGVDVDDLAAVPEVVGRHAFRIV